MSNTRPKARSRDLSALETRRLLLDAGMDMVFAQPAILATSVIKVTDVVRRAGVTPGALYHHWPNQDAYRRELLAEILRDDRFADFSALTSQLQDLLQGTAGEVLHVLSRAILMRNLKNPAIRVVMGLWVEGDEQMQAHIRAAFNSSDAQWAQIVGMFLDSYGLEVVPPLTVEHLVALASSFVFGFRIRFDIDPEKMDSPVFDQDASKQLAAGHLGIFDIALLSWFSSLVRPAQSAHRQKPEHTDNEDPWQRLLRFHELRSSPPGSAD